MSNVRVFVDGPDGAREVLHGKLISHTFTVSGRFRVNWTPDRDDDDTDWPRGDVIDGECRVVESEPKALGEGRR